MGLVCTLKKFSIGRLNYIVARQKAYNTVESLKIPLASNYRSTYNYYESGISPYEPRRQPGSASARECLQRIHGDVMQNIN